MREVAPAGWGTASHSRFYLRVPRLDWPYVRAGHQTEFRERKVPAFVHASSIPRPVVLWCSDRGHVYSATMAVLLEVRREPLGAISEESIARQGCSNMAEFRRRWASNHQQRGFRPLDVVTVYRIDPWTPETAAEWKDRIFNHLYGPFLDGVTRSAG